MDLEKKFLKAFSRSGTLSSTRSQHERYQKPPVKEANGYESKLKSVAPMLFGMLWWLSIFPRPRLTEARSREEQNTMYRKASEIS